MGIARDVGQGTRYKGRGDEGQGTKMKERGPEMKERGPEIRITSSKRIREKITITYTE